MSATSKPQRWRTALAGAALACAGAAAQAAYTEQEALGGDPNDAISIPQDLGTLTNGGLLQVDGSRLTTVDGGSSSDFYSFTLVEQMWVTFTLTPDSASAMPVLGLFQGSSVATGTLASATDDDAGDSVSRLTFNMKLSAGTYYTAVMGYRAHWWDFDGGGDAGWDYRLKLSGWTPAAPVPEASTLAMMMAGLGLLGLASRRRRSAA